MSNPNAEVSDIRMRVLLRDIGQILTVMNDQDNLEQIIKIVMVNEG